MKKVIAFAALLSLGVSHFALAQTMDNFGSTATSPTTNSGAMTGGMAPSSNMPGMTGSTNSAPGAGMPATGSAAPTVTNTQATVVPQPGSGATVPTMSGKAAGNAPLKGSNSFTEKQAERRLAKRGYTDIAGLAKDDSGVWRGTAMNKNSQSVSVALDYKGRITETK